MKNGGFERHVHACNNAMLPGARLPFVVGGKPVGWIAAPVAAALERFPEIVRSTDAIALTAPAALPDIARDLADRGMFRWRGEAFDVRVSPDQPALTQIDRGAIPTFGIQATGVHVNGLARRPGGLHVWIARRAKDKLLDPGKLDNIVAGGVPAGLGPKETLIKEAGEEAGISPGLAAQAIQVSCFGYAMERAEGLRRDFLYCYDLELPDDFVPRPADGEVEGFELWPIDQVFAAVRDTDDFKFNVSLVLIDLFLREGMIGGAEVDRLRADLR